MYGKIKEHLEHELAEIKAAGLYKNERIIESPQRAEITVGGRQVLNFCANNYLGLSDNPRLIEAAKKAMDARGYGMSSVRFICGCQDMHKQLEKAIADYFGTEDTILYAACFDANGGVFEPLFTEQDAIISDSLNHASIIDGVRLCKAVRYRYANADMAELEDCLKKAQAQRFHIIVTDGVFSMDGNAAPLDEICKLAEKYDALVMVDECHSAGVLGKTGRGITELYNLRGQVDILTGTLGKAFGGAVGGFTTGLIAVTQNDVVVDRFGDLFPIGMQIGLRVVFQVALDRCDFLGQVAVKVVFGRFLQDLEHPAGFRFVGDFLAFHKFDEGVVVRIGDRERAVVDRVGVVFLHVFVHEILDESHSQQSNGETADVLRLGEIGRAHV